MRDLNEVRITNIVDSLKNKYPGRENKVQKLKSKKTKLAGVQ